METVAVTGERINVRRKVLLVDDHPLFREGLLGVIAREVDFEIVADVGCASDAVAALQGSRIDIAIVDVLMPTTNGSSVTRELKALQPSCKVLGLSMLDEPTRIAEMLRAGADGFALKSQGAAEIVIAIRAVLAGDRYLPPDVARSHIETLVSSDDGWPLHRLTAREKEVFELLVRGHSNDVIAEQLKIARRTVETHRQHILKKVGARSLVDLIRLGLKHGIATTCA